MTKQNYKQTNKQTSRISGFGLYATVIPHHLIIKNKSNFKSISTETINFRHHPTVTKSTHFSFLFFFFFFLNPQNLTKIHRRNSIYRSSDHQRIVLKNGTSTCIKKIKMIQIGSSFNNPKTKDQETTQAREKKNCLMMWVLMVTLAKEDFAC